MGCLRLSECGHFFDRPDHKSAGSPRRGGNAPCSEARRRGGRGGPPVPQEHGCHLSISLPCEDIPETMRDTRLTARFNNQGS
jgi:hypothetical protein